MIRRRTPDEPNLPLALWSRTAVRELIAQRCGVEPAVWTVGKYLARWGDALRVGCGRKYYGAPPKGIAIGGRGSLEEVRVVVEAWRRRCNTVPPHSSFGHRPPAPAACGAGPFALEQARRMH